MNCLGCRLANKEEPIHLIYESDLISCFLDYDPFNAGHTLILPKKHIEELDELDEITAQSILKASMNLSKVLKSLYQPDGITICQNGGVFSELTHFHLHVVPRFKDQSFATFYTEESFNNEHLKQQFVTVKNQLTNALRQI
ncbi:HIT family protein [Alkalihalobacillus sp. NPDC078783]